jgi:F-type H+-transporting ATPase subunit gamma
MSDTIDGMKRQIGSASDLQAVVRTMKALAASSIGQYEQSVRALADYARTVSLGLGACLRAVPAQPAAAGRPAAPARPVIAVAFGSDQGLVGRFNEAVAEAVAASLGERPGTPRIWAVGERVDAQLAEVGLAPVGRYPVPTSVSTIAPLIGRILVDALRAGGHDQAFELHLFYNRRGPAASWTSTQLKLLPLDDDWRRQHTEQPWPTANLPEVMGEPGGTLAALIAEYLFVSLFRACAESLASENASRLAAMERAEQNIDELLTGLRRRFHQLRQSRIDEELFDLLAGFDALSKGASP